MSLTLKRTVPSFSHNAPCNEEFGSHWPAGQRFDLLPTRKQNNIRNFYYNGVDKGLVFLEQVGGEEVLLALAPDKILDWFESEETPT